VLHLREILLVKLAPEGSALLNAILPEERERLQERSAAFSEEDLLRGIDMLTRAEGELRQSPDPRVALELALLKLVQLRRLLPFTELVARVERLAGGAPALPPAPSGARVETPAPAPSRPRPAGRVEAGPETARRPASPPAEPVAESPAPVETKAEADATPSAEALLEKLRGLCETRPTLAQPLRGAQARLEGRTLTLTVSPDFVTMASMHADEYRALAKTATGRVIQVEFEAGAAPDEPEAAPSEEEARLKRLREEAEKEPAVQEALDLFDGRVVDVKEAKTSREDA
jgi:DNA polymerase-3 subunit gamma/tau